MSLADSLELERARKLFRRFQHREPTRGELVEIGGLEKPLIALGVGTAVSIGYKAFGNGENYYHEFAGSRPTVFVSADGKQIYFLGGEYTFTDRGFIK